MMEALRLVPLTLRDWEAEALPAVVVKAVKLPEVVRTGASGLMTVKAALTADSLPTVTVMSPEVAPSGTVAVREALLVKVTFVEAVGWGGLLGPCVVLGGPPGAGGGAPGGGGGGGGGGGV